MGFSRHILVGTSAGIILLVGIFPFCEASADISEGSIVGILRIYRSYSHGLFVLINVTVLDKISVLPKRWIGCHED